jgi:DNA replication protein DnaC
MSSGTCAKCGGIGWLVEEKEGMEVVVQCPSCRIRLKEKELLERARIPPRYFDRGFDVYSTQNSTQMDALKKAIDYVESYPEVRRGLLFLGPCGVGKTHLSVALLKAIVEGKQATGQFVDEAELLRRLQYSYGPDSPDTEREVLLPLMEVDLLVWDDLGTGRPTEWVRETIRMVINHRYTYRKQTIISSNWPLKVSGGGAWGGRKPVDATLPERIGTRLFSRIMEMCEIVEIDGPDARTEIHKAGMDFQRQTLSNGASLQIPSGLLVCPRCNSQQVKILDQANDRKARARSHVEISCLCEQCSEHFLARFYPRSAKVEYPLATDD